MSNKKKLYDVFCDNIYEQFAKGLEKNGLEWFTTWKPNLNCVNGKTNSHYRGVNALNLSFNGFADSRYFTLKQLESLGYRVKEGERYQGIVKFAYWDKERKEFLSREEYDRFNKNHSQFLKLYYVYNAEQLEGIELEPQVKSKMNTKFIEDICKKMGVKIVKGTHEKNPCYIPSLDEIHLPSSALFKSQNQLYATALHEIAHATGNAKRQNRDMSGDRKSESYAFEELVAEMTSAILCSHYGFENSVDDNHLAYVKSWLKHIKKDHKALVKAYKLAEESASYIVSIQKGEQFEFKSKVVEKELAKEEPKKEVKKTTKEKKENEPKKEEFEILELVNGHIEKHIARGYIRDVKGIKIGVAREVKRNKKFEKSEGLWLIYDMNSGLSFATCSKLKEATDVINTQIVKLQETYEDKDKIEALHTRLISTPMFA